MLRLSESDGYLKGGGPRSGREAVVHCRDSEVVHVHLLTVEAGQGGDSAQARVHPEKALRARVQQACHGVGHGAVLGIPGQHFLIIILWKYRVGTSETNTNNQNELMDLIHHCLECVE